MRIGWATFVVVMLPLAAQSQAADNRAIDRGLTAGSHEELTLIDRCAAQARVPIGVRPFSVAVRDSLLETCGSAVETRIAHRAPVWGELKVNTARASMETQGPVWAGKGLTIAGSAGVLGRWRGISYSLRPIGFWSQNRAYSPSRTIAMSLSNFGDPWYGNIDRPYRFGPDSYGRVDVGESFLRADSKWFGVGVSHASQAWGPARLQPLIVGPNAGGFPHVFLETGLPVNVGLGRLAGRWIVGKLAASSFGPSHAGTSSRLAVGAVASLLPRGLDGLELGVTRFFHLYDTPDVRDFTSYALPFSELLKSRIGSIEAGARAYNQLASVFLRLAPRASGVEAYAEYSREDHSADLRDVLVETDHNSAFMVGLRRVQSKGGRNTRLTIEASNGRVSHLARVRPQASPYEHTPIVEGHTVRGSPIGSPSLTGGGALAALWERDTESHTWTVMAAITRRAQNVEGGTWNGVAAGQYTIAVGRVFERAGHRWNAGVAVQPGFGDVPGTNVGFTIRIGR